MASPRWSAFHLIPKCARLLGGVFGSVCRLLVVAWGGLALYYSIVPWQWLRVLLASFFAITSIWMLWFAGEWRHAFRVFAGMFLGVLVLWTFTLPSHDRDWADDVAVMPRAQITGDLVTITGVRDFEYRSKTDFTPKWITRTARLSHLTGVDFFISYWTPVPGLMAHTFVSFTFDDAPPLCVSIEARKEKGEVYAPMASLFKQYELSYVVGEERDIAGLRTHHRAETVFLYRLRLNPDAARKLFTGYLQSINLLASMPQFYHLLQNNCTTNIQAHALRPELRDSFHWRVLFNGLSDELLHDLDLIDTSTPFAGLKRRSCINEAAHGSGLDETFSTRIRASIPVPAP